MKFYLARNCYLISGFKNKIAIDVQRHIFFPVPIDIFKYLSTNGYVNQNSEFFLLYEEILNYLISLRILTKTKIIYKGIQRDSYRSSFHIILENINLKLYKKVVRYLKSIPAEIIQFRLLDKYNNKDVFTLIRLILEKRFFQFEILLNYSLNCEDFVNNLYSTIQSYNCFPFINIFGSPYQIKIENKNICYFIQKIDNKSCGQVDKNLFIPNSKFFNLSFKYNSCLNGKISIDSEGNIRNCPSMPQSFGNIKDTTLLQALEHPDFKKYWNHKKDDIEICKDCEFRYICTDCRAYLEDPHNEYSKPLKCGYDPYTGEWSEWSTNPLKQAAIKYYGMGELVKNLKI